MKEQKIALQTVKEETITVKLSPTVSGKDVESILNTVKSDTCKDVNVDMTVIAIGSSESEEKEHNVPLNLTTAVKKEMDCSSCSSNKLYSEVPSYSQVQTQDCQSEYMKTL